MYFDTAQDEAQQYLKLGQEHQNKGELDRAIEFYQQAVASFPQHTASWLQLAQIYTAKQELDLALDCYQHIVQYDPTRNQVYGNIAKLKRDRGDLVAEIAIFHQAISENPNRPPWLYVQYGDALAKDKQVEKASAIFKKAIELYPNNRLAYGRMGRLMVDRKQITESLEYYHKAFEITSKHPIWTYISYSRALRANGSLDRAIEICELALEQGLENYGLYCHLGQIQAQKGATNDAITSYKKAIRLDPDKFPAYKQLGDVFRQANYLDYTIKCYQKALEINPQAQNIYRLLGDILVEQGRDREAQDCYAQL